MRVKETGIEVISRILDVDDPYNASRSSFTDSLKARGMEISPTTISRLRGGSTTGRKITRRLMGSEILRLGTVSLKDSFYLAVAELGLEVRALPNWGGKRLTSVGFVESLSEHLQVDSQALRRCFRAARTDLVLEELAHPEIDLLPTFYRVASRYIDDYTGVKDPSDSVKKLKNSWDGKTIGGFYRTLYAHFTTPVSLRTWPPYEVAALEAFYRVRMALGSTPSLFDSMVIQTDLFDVPDGRLVNRIIQSTGIKYDKGVTYDHLSVLLSGKP